jgi:hypothetical protein
LKMKAAKKHYEQTYYQDEIAERLKRKVHQRIQTNQMTFGRKIAYISSAAATAMVILVGLAFYSPQVASVAAKIPYLHLLFESKPVTEEVAEVLSSKGYHFGGMSFTQNPKKVAHVSIMGNQEYVNSVTTEVTAIVMNILKARNYDAYEVEIQRSLEAYPLETMTLKEEKELQTLALAQEMTEKVLLEYGYSKENFSAGQSNVMGMHINVLLPHTESRAREIQQKIQVGFETNQVEEVSLKVELYDHVKQELDQRWRPVIDTISQGMFNKKEYKVTEVSSDTSTEMVILNIKIAVSSTDENFQTIVQKIESDIREFMNTDQIKGIIQDEEYLIQIISPN